MPSKTFTRRDEAHYIVYRRLTMQGWTHDRAYAVATAIVEDIKTAGLTVTKRSSSVCWGVEGRP